jgi:hypothetical protein
MDKDLDFFKNEFRDSSRYPYTYACDWIKQLGFAYSRADATKFYKSAEEAKVFAEQYVTYWALEEMMIDFMSECVLAFGEKEQQ